MGLEKRVLFVRSHPLYVKKVLPLLLDADLAPVEVHNPEQLKQALLEPLAGVIVSTVVSSRDQVSVGTAVRLVRERQGDCPLVFAGMADTSAMRPSCERAVGEMASSPIMADTRSYKASAFKDRHRVFLLIGGEDLLTLSSCVVTSHALRAHFG